MDIQKPPLPAPADGPCHCTALRKASRRVSQLYDDALAASGLKTTQRAILAQLRRAGPLSISLLAEALVMDRGGLAHTLKPLQREGLLRLEQDPDDGRSRRVRLTEAGQRKLAETERAWAAAQAGFEQALGPEHAAALRALLAQLVVDDFQQVFVDRSAQVE